MRGIRTIAAAVATVLLHLVGVHGSALGQDSLSRAMDADVIRLISDSTESSLTDTVLIFSGEFVPLEGSYPLLSAGMFAAAGIAGDSLDLASLQGKYVLLDFWTSWCPPCLHEIPETNAFAEAFGDRDDFVFISVNQDAVTSGGDRAYVRELVDERAIEYPVLIDDGEPSLKRAFKVRAWPTRIMISPSGERLLPAEGRLTLSAAAEYLRRM